MSSRRMREHWQGLRQCFALYSRIPQKHLNWSDERRPNLLLYFPLVGWSKVTLLLTAFFGVLRLAFHLHLLESLLSPEGILILAMALTYGLHAFSGFMHLDGYLDWHDARGSNQERQRALEIMDDPHLGAFAVIRAFFYLSGEIALIFCILRGQERFLYTLGSWQQWAGRPLISELIVLWGYFCIALWLGTLGALLYTFSGKLIYKLPSAKASGMAHMLQAEAKGQRAKSLTRQSFVYLALFVLPLLLASWRGDLSWPHLATIALGLLVLYLYEPWKTRQIMRLYGGITGDICGHYLLQLEFSALTLAWLLSLAPRP